MRKLKIVYGICGLGNGHTFRQLPIISHFAQTCEIVLFAHDASYDFYSKYFSNNPSVHIIKVVIPFFVGDKNGVNFKATADSSFNKKDVFNINNLALGEAQNIIGEPDLAITDYEPVCAQYAYSYNCPLFTIDQQSKYLCGDFPKSLSGFTFKDEIMRLHMFFPKTSARIACSFFNVPQTNDTDGVLLFPPTLKKEITSIKRDAPDNNSVLVYISAAREFVQPLDEVLKICAATKKLKLHLFVDEINYTTIKDSVGPQTQIYKYGDPAFYTLLTVCGGIVSTAGHSLLSEAMFLGIPVYAIPVSPYEQHMNALIINKNGFGISHPNFNAERLEYFVNNLTKFQNNIKNDRDVLIRGVGQDKIIPFIKSKLSNLI